MVGVLEDRSPLVLRCVVLGDDMTLISDLAEAPALLIGLVGDVLASSALPAP